jgi:sugar phosphate isomerase/epimerase
MGIETFSFKELPTGPARIPAIIQLMKKAGLTECEIMSAHVEPAGVAETGWWVEDRNLPGMKESREKSRQWRLNVPMDYYTNIRKQFEDAGMRIFAYNLNFNDSFTDEERERSWQAAKALGADGCLGSFAISETARLVPFAEKHDMFISVHNHNNLVDPDQFATPQSFDKALALSPRVFACLDLGHYVAGNNDPIALIKKYPTRITNIHTRDRKRDNGPNLPYGQGDTPIKDVLRLIRDNKYPIRAYIEFEYGTMKSAIEEVQACLQYCKDALAS